MAKHRHVAINCEDLNESAVFSSKAFELEEVGRVGDMVRGGAVYLSDAVINAALIKISDPDFPHCKPGGLNHIGFVVDDSMLRWSGPRRSEPPHRTTPAQQVTWEIKMKTPDGGFDFTTHGWLGVGAMD